MKALSQLVETAISVMLFTWSRLSGAKSVTVAKSTTSRRYAATLGAMSTFSTDVKCQMQAESHSTQLLFIDVIVNLI